MRCSGGLESNPLPTASPTSIVAAIHPPPPPHRPHPYLPHHWREISARTKRISSCRAFLFKLGWPVIWCRANMGKGVRSSLPRRAKRFPPKEKGPVLILTLFRKSFRV